MIIEEEVEEEDMLSLKLEPENPFDPKAVKVLSKNGNQIGYLSREVIDRVRPAILNEVDIRVKVTWVSGQKMKGVGLRIEMIN